MNPSIAVLLANWRRFVTRIDAGFPPPSMLNSIELPDSRLKRAASARAARKVHSPDMAGGVPVSQ